jgi:hypothetical protein
MTNGWVGVQSLTRHPGPTVAQRWIETNQSREQVLETWHRCSARVNKRGSRLPGMLRTWKHACIPMFRGFKGVMPTWLTKLCSRLERMSASATISASAFPNPVRPRRCSPSFLGFLTVWSLYYHTLGWAKGNGSSSMTQVPNPRVCLFVGEISERFWYARTPKSLLLNSLFLAL